MPRVESLFSSQPLTGTPGVFDSSGPGFAEGAAEATRQIRGASRRAFASQKAALDRQTSALAQRAEAVSVLGKAVSGAGRDLVDIGIKLKRREDQARREDAFATARTNLLIADDDAKRVARQTGRPDGGDYESVYLDSLDNALPKILEGAAGDAELGRGIETMIGEVRTRGRIDMRTEAARAKGAHRLAKLEGRIADVANKAIGLEGLEQQIILQAGFDDIDAQYVVGTIDLGQRNTKMAALRAFVRDGTIAVDAGRDPAAAGQRLQAGGYDHLFVNEAEKVAAGRTIKAELAAQRAAAEARLDDDIDDHLERIETTGRGTPGMKARVKALDGDIARFADLEAQAELYFRTAQQIRWATPGDAEAALAEQKAAVQVDAEARTPDGLRRREFIQFGADKAADDRRERLADDPFAYAAEHPTLGRSRADVIALQKAMGVEAYAFMPAEQAAERVRTYAATADADKAALLRQWSDEAGKHRPALLRDLAAAQLPAPAQLLLRHADNPRLRAVLDRTFAAEGQGYRELTRDLSDDDVVRLRQEVAAQFEPVSDLPIAGVGAGRIGHGAQGELGQGTVPSELPVTTSPVDTSDGLQSDEVVDPIEANSAARTTPAEEAALSEEIVLDRAFDPEGAVTIRKEDADEISRQFDIYELEDRFDAARYAPIGGSSQKGVERFFADFNKPEVSDEIFDIAASQAGFDPERARLFRDILNVDDASYDAVRDRLFSIFQGSGPIRAMLFSTLERISFTDDPEIRLHLLRQYFNRLRPPPGKEIAEGIAVGGILGFIFPRIFRSPAGGGGSGSGVTPALRIQRFKKTPGKNEEIRLSAISPSTRGQPKDVFKRRAEDVFNKTNLKPSSPEENVRRGLSAFDVALKEKLVGGPGVVGRAMFRSDIGFITFIWGEAGNPKFGFERGMGFSKIVAKHGIEVIEPIINTIARGKIMGRRDVGTKKERFHIEYRGFRAVISKFNRNNVEAWLLTGFEIGDPSILDNPFDLNKLDAPVFFKGK